MALFISLSTNLLIYCTHCLIPRGSDIFVLLTGVSPVPTESLGYGFCSHWLS
jgi:hypothetical protein